MVINSIINKLKQQLSVNVKGRVYILYDECKIYVNIENSPYDMWCTTIPCLCVKLSEQKTASILAKLILSQYKEDILNKYFIK